jgi:hypothetical protein
MVPEVWRAKINGEKKEIYNEWYRLLDHNNVHGHWYSTV